MKVKEVIRLLKEDGWTLRNTEGDHRQFIHAAKSGKVTVAGRLSDDLHPKTMKSILRQAGWEE